MKFMFRKFLCALIFAGGLLGISLTGPAQASTCTIGLGPICVTIGGWLVFSHVPDGWAVAGILAIAMCGAAGTWVAARERRMAMALSSAASPASSGG